MRIVSRLLAALLIAATSITAVYADSGLDIEVKPESGSIELSGEMENSGTISVLVLNQNATAASVAEGVYNETSFARDFSAFLAKPDADKNSYVDYIRQMGEISKDLDIEYISNGVKGRYLAYIANDAGEGYFKYFTFVRSTDYPSLLEEFNGLDTSAKITEFIELYKEIFFTADGYDEISDDGKAIISKELLANKTDKAYTSFDKVTEDFNINLYIQQFYSVADVADAIKILSDNRAVLGISSLNRNFHSGNDTYKYNIVKKVRDKGPVGYAQWCKNFKEAAPAKDTESSSGGGGGAGGGGMGGGAVGGADKNPPRDEIYSQFGQEEKYEQKPQQPVFSDMPLTHWAYESVVRLSQRGIISGDGNNKFRPDDSITRAEFLKIILGAMNLQDDTAACGFDDVAEDAWYYKYVSTAQRLDIVSGDENNNFRPDDKISRQDAVKIMYNAAMFKNYIIKGTRDYAEFKDEEKIADYAEVPLKTMYCAEIINGYEDGSFAPTDSVTRAEAAKMTFSFLQKCI